MPCTCPQVGHGNSGRARASSRGPPPGWWPKCRAAPPIPLPRHRAHFLATSHQAAGRKCEPSRCGGISSALTAALVRVDP
eukprot:7852250-Lingulodinium_polyedra.AAC.1